jgi:hypothetical protein
MLEVVTSAVGQGRTFVLIDKALQLKGKTLFISLEMSENEIIRRMFNINTLKYKKNINGNQINIKNFDSIITIHELEEYVKVSSDKYDNILIDQISCVDMEDLDSSGLTRNNLITNFYQQLSETLGKNIIITHNLNREFYGVNDIEKLDECVGSIVKNLNKVTEYTKGDFSVTQVFKKDNNVFKKEYPSDVTSEVINLDLYNKQFN